MYKVVLAFLLFAAACFGQFTTTARHIGWGASLPATCSPNTGDIFFKTTATIGPYYCSAANTWTANGASGGCAGTILKILIADGSGACTASTTFLNGGIFYKTADGTSAFKFNKADGTTVVLNIDSTNGRLGIQQGTPTAKLDVSGTSDFGLYGNWQSSGASGLVYNQFKNGTVTGFYGISGSLWGTGNVTNALNFGTQSAHSVAFATNDTVRMLISSTGVITLPAATGLLTGTTDGLATVTIDFASVTDGTINESSQTVSGCVAGDIVVVGPPAGLETGLIASGVASAANTVKVRLLNLSGAAVDPASGSYILECVH